MKRRAYYHFICCFLCCLFVLFAKAQDRPAKESIAPFISALDTLRNTLPAEKLYLHFDKPAYALEDTLWFKAYLFEGPFLAGSEKSGLFYVELADGQNRVVKRMKFPVQYGLGWGNIALKEKEFQPGNYTLRAYTNWMRNFGEETLFTRSIQVAAFSEQSWLVKTNTQLTPTQGKDSVRVALQFSGTDKKPVGRRELELRVMQGDNVLYRNKANTKDDGSLDLRFLLPAKAAAKDIRIVAEEQKKDEGNRKVEIPLQLSRAANTDLQFMPEGGSLVAGIRASVGFKAIGEDGKGVQAEGIVLNSKQQEIARFRSLYKGMGSFELAPEAGEHYTAQLSFADGTTKSYALPDVQAAGTVLRIINPPGSAKLEVQISATPDVQSKAGSFYLIGQARGVVCYAKAIDPSGGTVTNSIDKSIFPSGIARFSLLNAGQQPLNERIVYINHQDNLTISIQPTGTAFHSRDNIALELHVTDKEGKPVQGSFSLAVTDDNQIKAGSNTNNINTHLLLTSDLKGYIEAPDYYTGTTNEAHKALDNLLLTQGWTGYDWKDVFQLKTPAFVAEPEFRITGRATGTLGAIPNAKVALYSWKPFLLLDTITDKNGRFLFRNIPFADTASYLVQAYNRNGKSSTMNIEVYEWQPPVFKSAGEKLMPWYLNSDSTVLINIKENIVRQKAEGRILNGGIMLKEVQVTARKVVMESNNLNGPGEADQVLDERDLQIEGKLNLWDLLFKRVEGFTTGSGKPIRVSETVSMPELTYRIKNLKVKFIIDGIDVDRGYHYNDPLPGADVGEAVAERYQFIKNILGNFTAADVMGIEVLYNTQYKGKYDQTFLSGTEAMQLSKTGRNTSIQEFAYLEITTRSGKGPFINKTHGIYAYKPLPFSLPRQFYSPKYTVTNKDKPLPDFRATLHWEPNIVTDAEGKATVSFYAADRHTTYSIIVEGSDMNGKAGSVTKEALVKVGADF